MLEFPRWKIVLVILVSLAGMLLALPSVLPESWRDTAGTWLPNRTVNLGLDLRGGSHLLLEVDFSAYLQDQFETLQEETRLALRAERIGYTAFKVTESGVTFTLTDQSQVEAARTALGDIGEGVQIDNALNVFNLTLTEQELRRLRQQVLEQSIEIVRRRIDETGTREPTIQRQGDDRILLQVPGLDDPETLKRLLGQTANMTFHLVDERGSPSRLAAGKAPPGSMVLPYQETIPGEQPEVIAVKRRAILSGDLLVDSNTTYEQGRPVVSFRFNTLGARKFGDVTTSHVGERFAIVLDGKVISAPVIREPILGGSGIISGNFTVESAYELALLLRAGALPAPLNVVEERTVGPSLGQDSIDAGKKAAALGVVLVMAFMAIIYGRFGVYSNIALIMNIVFILAALALFQATLTLPGIAGIVLTIGMAVDANVLIFERIREELQIGKTVMAAVDNGFRLAFRTIVDSNITTLLAALLLFYFGSGTVKGFAVTLSIGILASMFSAILLTRMMVVLWVRRNRPTTLSL